LRAGRGSVLLRVAVSAVLLGLLFALVDRGELGRRLAGADPWLAISALGLLTLDRLLMAWKWWLLVRGRDAAVSLGAAVRAYYVASFAGLFLPMTVGADAIRVASLAGPGRTAGLVASVVLERTVGALAQAALATVAVTLLVARGLGTGVGPGARWALGFGLMLAFVLFPLSFRVAGWTGALLQRTGGLGGTLGRMAMAYAGYAGSAGLVAGFFALTLLEGAFPVAIHYVAGRAVGLDPGWTLYVATVPIVFFVARLPVSLGGLGVVEGSFVYLAGVFGLGPTEAFSVAVLTEVLLLAALVPGALAYLLPAGDPVKERAR
jgi:uncharacterized membrane protein YbhN (UPF0104 family)